MTLEKPYKRYMVFAFYDYYPSGGLEDCIASFDKLENAKESAKRCTSNEGVYNCQNFQIFDRVEGKEVEQSDRKVR